MYVATRKTLFTLLGRTLAAAGVVISMGVCVQAHAAPLIANNGWSTFDVDSFAASSGGLEWIDTSTYAPLAFDFTIAAGSQGNLTVVDAGFAGDTFTVFNGLVTLGTTSSVPVTEYNDSPPNIGLDYSAAFADHANFSYATYNLGAGTYSIRGLLAQSVTIGRTPFLPGEPLNATVGALRLEVSPVPEPETVAMLLAGLGLIGATLRRRA